MSYDLTKAAWTFIGFFPFWLLLLGGGIAGCIAVVGMALDWVRRGCP